MRKSFVHSNYIIGAFGPKDYLYESIKSNASGRKYTRVRCGGKSFIFCKYYNLQKEKDLAYLSKIFSLSGISSVCIYHEDYNKKFNIQKDLGRNTASDLYKNDVSKRDCLLKDVLNICVNMSVNVNAKVDYSVLSGSIFDSQRISNDVLSFKENVLKRFGFIQNKLLESDFEKIIIEYSKIPESLYFFTHRDFNLRNLIVNDKGISVIDIQDGNRGPITYDLASIFSSSSFEFNIFLFKKYIGFYKNIFYKKTKIKLGDDFEKKVLVTMCLRLMQAMSSYGRLYNNKIYKNDFLQEKIIGYMDRLCEITLILKDFFGFELDGLYGMCKQKFFLYKKIDEIPIIIESFSYKKEIPIINQNQINFVFDARLFINPGRIDRLIKYTGIDKPVIDFFEKDTEILRSIKKFYENIKIILNSKYKYSEKIDSIRILIGCTGGRHRSVYFSEALSNILRKDKRKCLIIHNNI